jgi:glyceraldehyde 3-phosphate dehydrogenase
LPARVGINGLGRIGRCLVRLACERPDLDVVAVNDVASPQTLAHLLRHDSTGGAWRLPVEAGDGWLSIQGKRIPCTASRHPAEVPWREAGAEVVVEATGLFRDRRGAAGHLAAGAQRVIISAPSPDADFTAVVGVNHYDYDPKLHRVLSNASCTTNCIAPILMLIEKDPGIEAASLSTIHCYTNDQPLMDAPHRDLRRARAAGLSMIPTTTSAELALGKIFPNLAGKITCLAVRVPTAQVSAVDLAILLARDADLKAVRETFRAAARGPLASLFGYAEEELVSIDYRGDSRSAVVDGPLLAMPSSRLLRVFAWYDNEVGYTHRLADLILHLSRVAGEER